MPFLQVYLEKLLGNKIRSRSFVQKITKDVAVVGEIPLLEKNEEEVIEKNDRSVLAESFRILRTNLQYLFVTTTNKEE